MRINYIKSFFKNLKKVGQHKDYTNTSCAGRNFNVTLLDKVEEKQEVKEINIDEALSILLQNNVISSIGYHRESIKFYPWQERLIVNMANCILDLRTKI
jgi:hypothetical protein